MVTRWLRIEEVCQGLGIAKTTAYKRIGLPPEDPHHLPSRLIGGQRRVREVDMRDHAARMRAEAIEHQALGEVYDMGAAEIAALFDISERSALRLLADGHIPSRWVRHVDEDGHVSWQERRATRADVEAYAS